MENLQIKKTNSDLYSVCLKALDMAQLAAPQAADWPALLEEVEIAGPQDFDLRDLIPEQRFTLTAALSACHAALAERGRPHDYHVIGALSVALARIRAEGAAA